MLEPQLAIRKKKNINKVPITTIDSRSASRLVQELYFICSLMFGI